MWGLFGDEAVGEEAEVLVVADDEVIEEVDVEDVAGLDEFGGYFFIGAAGYGLPDGWLWTTMMAFALASRAPL